MFDLHLWDGWLWQKKGSIHWFISTHSPATCWFIAVVYMFLVNILLFGDPRTCRYCLVFFYSGVHPCLLLIGGNYSACLLTRFIFRAAHLDKHSYRSRIFVMKSYFGVHGNHCLLSTKSSMASLLSQLPIYIMDLFFPIKSFFFGGFHGSPQAMQCSTMSGCSNDMEARGSAVENFLSWVELASRKTEDIRLEHNLRSPRIFEFLDLKMFPNIY